MKKNKKVRYFRVQHIEPCGMGYYAVTVYTIVGKAANTCTAIESASVYTWSLPLPTLKIEPANRLCLN